MKIIEVVATIVKNNNKVLVICIGDLHREILEELEGSIKLNTYNDYTLTPKDKLNKVKWIHTDLDIVDKSIKII
ncbi:hypothetical protein GKD14_11235 [Paeniclostridium sordellii]|uniref:hypothetical protein n=1 Tax=Paraclostridium sordellii TaxID=1505 RepID=UPI000C75FEA4|nr:hypothetical protein [Paeniclostridium sordellii]AUN13842.1 hypothetical protein RSJ16_06220 [Paeniclostridium sordellii]MRZ79899.1 hypothetical protein [Paeniclostridium sordellii]MSB59515.1 hypothetical protein [Paeniclostridium sordellii]